MSKTAYFLSCVNLTQSKEIKTTQHITHLAKFEIYILVLIKWCPFMTLKTCNNWVRNTTFF